MNKFFKETNKTARVVYEFHAGHRVRFESKEQALEEAIKYSVGRDVDEYVYIYRVDIHKTMGEVMGYEKLIEVSEVKSLVMVVNPRKSLDTVGGWVDYE